MCQAEKILLSTPSTDYNTKLSLYEKLGDGAANLKIYKKAILYYKSMLEAALNSGRSGAALSPCYCSLAQTYSDDQQYDLALEYFQKELVVNITNVKDCATSLMSIAETLDFQDKDFCEIDEYYKRALKMAQDKRNSIEKQVIIRYTMFLQKHGKHTDVQNVQNLLSKFDGILSSDEEIVSNIGENIDTDEITGTDNYIISEFPGNFTLKIVLTVELKEKYIS